MDPWVIILVIIIVISFGILAVLIYQIRHELKLQKIVTAGDDDICHNNTLVYPQRTNTSGKIDIKSDIKLDITDTGTNNRIYIGEGSKGNAKITFSGNNSVICIGSNVVLKDVDIRIKYRNGLIQIGDNVRIYEHTKLISGTGLGGCIQPDNGDIIKKVNSIIIGSNCLISEDVVFRNTDSHPIFSIDGDVLNTPTKGIIVENNVWIGHRASILKNVTIGSGSIIALGAVISRSVPKNNVARGNPMILTSMAGKYWKINCKKHGGGNDFPYLKYSLPPALTMFNTIKNTKTYKTFQQNNGSNVIIRTFPGDYLNADALSNHFIEDVRIDCRAGLKPTPREVWDKIAPGKRGSTKHMLREEIYNQTRECNTFNPVFVKWILEQLFSTDLSDIIMLDPSSGWGDRLIGAAAAGIKQYIGYDPNPRLADCYKQMIEMFTKSDQDFSVRTEPFTWKKHSSVNIALTSPPYFNYEEYVLPGGIGEDEQSIGKYPKYGDWKEKMYVPYITDMFNAVIPGGWIIVYIEDYILENKYYPLRKLTQEILENLGAKEHPSFGLQIRLVGVKPKTRWALCYKK
jgi:acetyltransferase-like isoleucine patch superfamily enzyme